MNKEYLSFSGMNRQAVGGPHLIIDIQGVINEKGELVVYWSYNENIHQALTIENVSNQLKEVLATLISYCGGDSSDDSETVLGGFTASDFTLLLKTTTTSTEMYDDDEQNKLDSVVGRGKNIEDIYPLTPMQEGMLFHSLYAPNSEQYFEQFRWTMKGQLNKLALKGSWEQVMHRHATLHSGFVWETFSSPHQVVLQKVMLPWREFDWSTEYYYDIDGEDSNNNSNNKDDVLVLRHRIE